MNCSKFNPSVPFNANSYLSMIAEFISDNEADESLKEFIQPLSAAVMQLQQATAWLAKAAAVNMEEVGAAAYDYLKLASLVTLAYLWAQMAKTSLAASQQSDEPFYRSKLKTARFFMQRILPQTASLNATIQSGAALMMNFNTFKTRVLQPVNI